MIKIDNISVSPELMFHAIKGMRNPLNSWNKMDSKIANDSLFNFNFLFGEKDLELARRLIKAGPEHSKFLRQIPIMMDITAPRYMWTEIDQYKIGTTTDSCSTMHTLTKAPITLDSFSFDMSDGESSIEDPNILTFIDFLEELRIEYNDTKNPETWRLLIQSLPQSFNQMRTWSGSYINLFNMYKQRKTHKLVEWHNFCDIIWNSVPYFSELFKEE